ncbi:MAG TPA: hypothetical protein VGD36_04120 [Xanthobacteraceae bacterium]
MVLYSLEALDTDPRWGNVFYSRVSDAQYAWLTNDLAANAANKSGIVVLLHHPMWYMWSDWDRVHRLLAQYRANTVIAGHFHYNQVDSRIDGIQYHVVGATGGDTKRGTPNAGALQHVSVLTINDDRSLDFRMVPLSPYVQIVWTGRQVMDRVQAADSLLGNLWSFAGNSPVFLQNGALVAACGASAPAKLLLSQLGNATAAPVDVSISVTPGVTVTGTFGDGFCLQDVGPFSCRLKESAGVGMSNTSTVQASFGAAPLWTGTITAASPPPAVGDKIGVTVAISFTADNQTFTVDQSGTTTVQPCN